MSKPKNKPHTKSLGPFFMEKWSETTGKVIFYAAFFWEGGQFAHSQID
jgi:hypothetical protein